MSLQSLTNLPTLIHKPLELAIDLIQSEFGDEVAMVWLFGSYARGDFINDRRVGKDGVVSEYQSDIDILLVLNAPLVAGRTNQNERKLKKLAARVDKLTHALHDHPEIDRSIHLIHETLDRFNDALNHSEYFYLDVVNEGIQLVNNGAEMAQPQQMSAEKRREYGIKYFEMLFEQILEFQQSFEFHYQRQHKALAMFNLHQLTEHLFKVYLLVKTHYKPRTHKLWALRDTVKTLDEYVVELLPRDTQEQQDQFAFLNDAYVDSRYVPEYKVEPTTLDALAERVQTFEHWVYEQCLSIIDGFVPEQVYSTNYELAYPLLNMDKVRTELLPENVIQKMEGLLNQERSDKEQALANEAKERSEKEQALEELEKAKQKLRDAGLE